MDYYYDDDYELSDLCLLCYDFSYDLMCSESFFYFLCDFSYFLSFLYFYSFFNNFFLSSS